MPNHFSDSIVQHTAAAIEKLLDRIDLNLFVDDDRRSNLNKQDLIRKYGNDRFGVLYWACWMAQGNALNGPLLCRKMAKGSTQFGDYCIFIREMKKTKEKLSLLYAAADPLRWRRCIDAFDAFRHFRPDIQLLATSKIDPWASLILMANFPTDVHRDLNDAHHMLSGIASSGTFFNSWLIVYSAGFKMRIKPEHAILLNTHVLPHFADSREPDEKSDLDQGDESELQTDELKSNERELNLNEDYNSASDQYILSFFNHQSIQDWVKSEV